MKNEFKVLDYSPDAVESKDHIATAYLQVKTADGMTFWTLVPDWRKYFPYYPKASKWGLGEELRKNISGKTVALEISLVNLEPTIKLSNEEKKLVQGPNAGHADSTQLFGKIIEKSESETKEFEKLFVDCRIIIKVGEKKGKFSLGDYVKASGILQAKILSIEGEEFE